jgi:hypothetical protein
LTRRIFQTFTIGVYGGCGSSIDCNDYLKDLVEEIKLIEADGGVLLQQISNQMERGRYSKSTSQYDNLVLNTKKKYPLHVE